jgi:hypothetical protein
MRPMLALVFIGLAGSAHAKKDDDEGLPLVVTVVDARTGAPIPFAAVREQQEKALHGVNRETGQFSTTMLYPSYNDAIPLEKGMELTLEVTAAGYAPSRVRYEMRRRGNKILVSLEPMAIAPTVGSDPVFQFRRDLPRGGREMTPEELEQLEAEAAEARAAREAERESSP